MTTETKPARKQDYTGDRFGDWVVMSKAPARGGKRYWNVTNIWTDETMCVPQTSLKDLALAKNLADKAAAVDAARNQEDDVAKSAEITARVLAGNYADNPFKVPAAAFEPKFTEPAFTDLDATSDEGVDNPFGDHLVIDLLGPALKFDEEPDPFIGKGNLYENVEAFVTTLVENLATTMVTLIDEWKSIAVKQLMEGVKIENAAP